MRELHDNDFATEVLQSKDPVLVDFWAPWCGPCRAMTPVVDQLAAENSGRVKVVKVNVDQSPTTATSYAIDSIPTLVLFKDGAVVERLVGLRPKGELQAAIDRVLN
jgi:thioredoxin 1